RSDLEAADGRLGDALFGFGAVGAVLGDLVLRVVHVPELLEAEDRERTQIDAAGDVVEVHWVGRAEPLPTVRAEIRIPTGLVVHVDGETRLVVAVARRRGEPDPAATLQVPLVEQVLLRQRAERRVDRQRRAA